MCDSFLHPSELLFQRFLHHDRIMDGLDEKYAPETDIILSAEEIEGKLKITDIASSNPGEKIVDFIKRFVEDHPDTNNLFVYMSGERRSGYGNSPFLGYAPPITIDLG